MLCFGTVAVLTTVPLSNALAQVSSSYAAFGLVLAALAGVSFYTSISGLVKAELFPMHVRALGAGLSYAIANAIFGDCGSVAASAVWAGGGSGPPGLREVKADASRSGVS